MVGDELELTERFIGGKGGVDFLRSPTVELNGVRGFVIRLFAKITLNIELNS